MQRRCNDDAVKRRSKVNSPSFCQFSPSSPSRYSSVVSIHALLAECDWRALARAIEEKVSIHALLAECDHRRTVESLQHQRFNPRTPCGVRPGCWACSTPGSLFQSTHSLRSATAVMDALERACEVSIHALLAECDHRGRHRRKRRGSFNPRTPCGVRHKPEYFIRTLLKFQSTHSLRSATGKPACQVPGIRGFNPRTPCGVRRIGNWPGSLVSQFQSTHSLRSATHTKHKTS